MDFSILLGLALGGALIGFTIGLDETMTALLQPMSIIIVLGGTVVSGLLNFPSSQLKRAVQSLKVIFSLRQVSYIEDIEWLSSLANKARKEGLDSILPDLEPCKDHFLHDGLQLVVDRLSTEELEKVLKEDISYIAKRHMLSINVFEQLGRYAPAFGLLGTVIGLIRLLANLTDPSQVGPGMAIALVTTFYGVFFANLIFYPIAGRLQACSFEEALQKELFLVGLIALAKNEPAFVIREKMMLFLTGKEREKSS
ncbi:motility protein A [bacterium]|jgi:chemotaxis protein MotA|nr:motility protein A [bacterium]